MNDDKKTAMFSQTYGRFEAKMKLPAGEGCQGLWPAFWLLPVDSYYGAWPLSGEIDIMEARGREGNKVDGTIHFGKPWPNDGSAGDSYVWEDDPLAITGYHIYSVDWTSTYMSFQVDGVEYYRTENWYSQDDNNPQKYAFPAPFDQEFYIVLNMAVGGTYDGNLNPSASALPAEMKVDYVRVYQSTDDIAEDYIAPEPVVEADPIPKDAKTDLIDVDFRDVKKGVNDGDEKNINGWNLLTLAAYGGAADFATTKIDGDTFGKISIANSGSQTYSVQLTQKLSLPQGHWYTLSFDAKADAARGIIAKIGGDGTNSWSAYNSATSKLGKDVKHYEYTFQMLNKTDTSSRLEINMGGGSKAAVYIANVKFEEAEGLKINHDVKKSPLENGNHIYNGQFNLGDVSRMAYWHTSDPDGRVVRDGNEYVFQSAGASALYQTGIELLQADTYKLTFDTKALSEQKIAVKISDKAGNIYAQDEINVGDSETPCEFEFTMPESVTDKDAMLTIEFPAADIRVDNFLMTRETYNNVDYTGLNFYPLTNGSFELGQEGWSTYGTTLSIASEDGSQIGRVNGTRSANKWDALLSHDTMDLIGGYTYELSFDAKADKAATIDVAMEDASYSRYFQQTNVEIGTGWQNYSYTFKLSSDTNLALKFLIGGAKEAYDLNLDNVVLKIKGAPEKPGDLIPAQYNTVDQDVVMAVSGADDWKENARVFLDDKKLETGQYHFIDNGLVLDGDLFTESREYSIYTKSNGYSDTPKIYFKVYPANGDLICNGDFLFGNTAWGQYIHGGDSADLQYNRDYLAGKYLHAEGDEWGNPAVPWSIQLTQKLNVMEAGKYDISFVAFSEIERYFIVGLAGGDVQKVKIGTEPAEYTITLNVATPGSYDLQFFMGTVNPNAENGYFAPDGFVDFDEHAFYVDSVSMLPEGTEVSKDDSELYLPSDPEYTGETEEPGETEETGETEEPGEPYVILNGAEATWTPESGEGFTIRGNGDFDKFTGVKVDGKLVDRSNYTVREGSTIITFTEEFLKTLASGNHNVEIFWTDGSVATSFDVKTEPQNEKLQNEKLQNEKPQKEETRKEEPRKEEEQIIKTQNNVTSVVTSPKTGDTTSAIGWYVFVLIFGMGLLILGRKKCK